MILYIDSENNHLVEPLESKKTTAYFLLAKVNNHVNPIPTMISLSFHEDET